MHRVPSNYISPEELIEMEKSMTTEQRDKQQRYRKMKEQEDRFKPYYDLLNLWSKQLILEDEKLMYAHAFPPSLAEHAEELGIEKSAIDNLEVYIVSREEWKDMAANGFGLDNDALDLLENYVKGKTKDFPDLGIGVDKTQEILALRRGHAIAEEVVELLPEGFTLFVGHYHKILKTFGTKNRQLFRPGAGFNPRAVPGDYGHDYANYVFFDSENPQETSNGFYGINYDREEVNREMEAVKNAR